jgi:hypothetical protein
MIGWILVFMILSACLVDRKAVVERQAGVIEPQKLDGVYELISESTDLTKPRRVTLKMLASDWAGIWHFQDGYYSQIIMKRRRDTFFSGKVEDLGFESFAGRYEVEGANVRLIRDYAIHPFVVGRSALKTYRVDGDTLTLIERLQPYLEDSREGEITTVLRRMK